MSMDTPPSAPPPRASISDTILEFANPVLSQVEQPAPLEVIKRALEIAITVWNAHVMAMPDWGHPEHLEGLTQLIAVSDSAHLLGTVASLTERRHTSFGDDTRVVSKWDLVTDELGRMRFDCTARLPASKS